MLHMPDPYYAAACQTDFPAPRRRGEIQDRTKAMIQMAEQTLSAYEPNHDIRLFVFPEFAHAAPIYPTVEELNRHLAVEVPNEHVDAYADFCAEHGCWIQTGTFLEHVPEHGSDVIFNTTVLVGPGGIELIYRKVNPWIPWEVSASPHDLDPNGDHFPVADTEIGRIGVAVCYDWLFPEAIRQLAMNGAEVINRVSAYMDPWGSQPPMDWWTLINRTRALENTAYVVACNQGASREHFPPFSWPGSSMIVDYDGRILSQADAGPGERVVVAPIAIDVLRYERERRLGHDMRSHLRSEAYDYLRTGHLAPAGVHPITSSSLEERIVSARSQGVPHEH